MEFNCPSRLAKPRNKQALFVVVCSQRKLFDFLFSVDTEELRKGCKSENQKVGQEPEMSAKQRESPDVPRAAPGLKVSAGIFVN